ncbi:hypothetical protein B0H17DRAFT_1211437 [Mycena rosella]|uniref:Uncharacterized protein n=1 Tax=Mycena rosella TaxID=1033263 RepID=A0AAD7CU80_MYCRO|nr:hypothetical protein B0H17DRAFT_1211437 [Mycena rosella]
MLPPSFSSNNLFNPFVQRDPWPTPSLSGSFLPPRSRRLRRHVPYRSRRMMHVLCTRLSRSTSTTLHRPIRKRTLPRTLSMLILSSRCLTRNRNSSTPKRTLSPSTLPISCLALSVLLSFFPASPPCRIFRPHPVTRLASRTGITPSLHQLRNLYTWWDRSRRCTLSTANWKDNDKLSFERNDWRDFSVKVENQLGIIPGMAKYLESTAEDPNLCPSAQMYPAHNHVWVDTNHVVCSFLRDVLTVTERTHVAHCKMSMEI